MGERRTLTTGAKPLFAAASLALIAGLTLFPHPGDPVREGVLCLACGVTGGVDAVLNIALFVPLGAALWLLTRRSGIAVALGFAVSLAVEAAQGLLIAGRDATVSDLLANTLGAWAGAVLARHALALVSPSPSVASLLARSYALFSALLLIASYFLFTPVVPYQKLFVQWQPKRQGYDTLQGALRDLKLNGATLQGGQRIDPRALPFVDSSSGSLMLAADVSLWSLSRRIAPVARLANPFHETAALSMAQAFALFRVETVAARLRLRVPHAAARCAPVDGRPPSPAMPWELAIAGTLHGRVIRIECDAGGDSRAAVHSVHLRPALLWSLLWPRQLVLGARERATTAACLLLFLLPLGYWWAASNATRSPAGRATAAPLWALVLPVAVLIVTATRGSAGVVGGDIAGAAAGIACGALVARLTARVGFLG